MNRSSKEIEYWHDGWNQSGWMFNKTGWTNKDLGINLVDNSSTCSNLYRCDDFLMPIHCVWKAQVFTYEYSTFFACFILCHSVEYQCVTIN